MAVFIALPIHDPARYGLSYEHHSDLEFLALEEIRLLSAISLAKSASSGARSAYPLPFSLDMPLTPSWSRQELLEIAESFPSTFKNNGMFDFYSHGLTLPPLLGGPDYTAAKEMTRDEIKVANLIMRKLKLTDYLAIRGLNAMLKSDMLFAHFQFHEVALSYLHIAMEATYQMTLRELREQGLENPTPRDAGKFIDEEFQNDISSGNYFHEYYEDRIKLVHPNSRYGVFPFPPLISDDYFFLRVDLQHVFTRLINGKPLSIHLE